MKSIRNPEAPLLARTASERGQVADALRNSIPQMADPGVVRPDNYAQIPDLAKRGKARAAKFMGTLDGMIGAKPFVCGDASTAADTDAFIYVKFAKWAEVEPGAAQGNLKRLYGAVGKGVARTSKLISHVKFRNIVVLYFAL